METERLRLSDKKDLMPSKISVVAQRLIKNDPVLYFLNNCRLIYKSLMPSIVNSDDGFVDFTDTFTQSDTMASISRIEPLKLPVALSCNILQLHTTDQDIVNRDYNHHSKHSESLEL
jgi:hypothetical protein